MQNAAKVETYPNPKYFSKVRDKLKALPINKIVDEVIASAQAGNIAILTGQTGSGKTLGTTSELADNSDHQVLALEPRRFLSINGAETIAELSEHIVGQEVGYAIGRKSGERSKFSDDSKLVFATYGYALNSELLNSAKTIIFDEVHESGVSTSLARALVYERLKTDKSLRVIEMSATLNAPKQAAFWGDAANTELFHAEGNTYPCEFRHEKKKLVSEIVKDLIQKDNRKGIAVFRPGVPETKATAEVLEKTLKDAGIDNIEIATIYGDMTMEERVEAMKPPKDGNVKVLVGTNVIESGVNIPWLDAGVSDGKTKVPYYRDNGATALVTEELPQWRIIQQEGRVKRFCPGIFVLASELGMKQRPKDSSPEITRVSLNSLVMQAANYHKNPLELHYDADVDPNRIWMAKKDLMRMRLLNDDWTLTEKGEYVNSLPLSAENATMIWAAPAEIREDVTMLAAIMEIGGLREEDRKTHKQDNNSDWLDALKIFKKLGMEADEEKCLRHNVNYKKYQDTKELFEELSNRHDKRTKEEEKTPTRPATDEELVQVMLHGYVNHLFDMREPFIDLIRGKNKDFPEGYKKDQYSVVSKERGHRFAIADLREQGSNSEKPLIVAQNITSVPTDALLKFARSYPGLLSDLTFTLDNQAQSSTEKEKKEKKKNRYSFTVKYFDNTLIKIRIPKDISPEMEAFIEPAFSEFRKEKEPEIKANQPIGINNTDIEEVQEPKKAKRKWR